VNHHVLQPDHEVQHDHRDQHGRPVGELEGVEHAPAGGLGEQRHAHGGGRHSLITLCACLTLLQACGPLTIRDTTTKTHVPIQTGTLELHQEVSFPSERTRIFFQDGGIVASINEFKPHCQLEIDPLRDVVQKVQPDRFEITRVTTRIDQVVMTRPVQLATVRMGGSMLFGKSDGGVSRHTLVYLFRLQSERQPEVRQLNCGGAFDDPGLAEWPTLQDIAHALGDYATLTLD
jgi:hypothetical protein